MNILSTIFGGLGKAIAGPAQAYIEGRTKLKVIRTVGKQQIAKARILAEIKKIEGESQRDLTYDLQALENQKTSWKDEFLTLVFTFPFMISFLSPFIDALFNTKISPEVANAWHTVGLAPDWYQWIMIGIVASVYGLRWLFRQSNPLKKLTGTKKPSEEG